MNEKELNDLLGNLSKLVPTLLVVGKTTDGDGVLFMGSPEENEREMTIDLCDAIATTIGKNKKLQEVFTLLYYIICMRILSMQKRCISH